MCAKFIQITRLTKLHLWTNQIHCLSKIIPIFPPFLVYSISSDQPPFQLSIRSDPYRCLPYPHILRAPPFLHLLYSGQPPQIPSLPYPLIRMAPIFVHLLSSIQSLPFLLYPTFSLECPLPLFTSSLLFNLRPIPSRPYPHI